MAKAQTPKRGEIWLVDFDPAVGAEIRKARPAVVVSVDAVGRLPLRIVVPITDWKPVYSSYAWLSKYRPVPETNCIKTPARTPFKSSRSLRIAL